MKNVNVLNTFEGLGLACTRELSNETIIFIQSERDSFVDIWFMPTTSQSYWSYSVNLNDPTPRQFLFETNSNYFDETETLSDMISLKDRTFRYFDPSSQIEMLFTLKKVLHKYMLTQVKYQPEAIKGIRVIEKALAQC